MGREDGTLKFFEVILGDPALLADEVPMLRSKRRAYRGLTSAGKKAKSTLRKRGKEDGKDCAGKG